MEDALFLCPKPPLRSFTKAMGPGRTDPSWRSGNYCVTGGVPPIASEPTPSPRLWATPPGATPAKLCEHTTRIEKQILKPELSTWPAIGTFYLAPTLPPGRHSPGPSGDTAGSTLPDRPCRKRLAGILRGGSAPLQRVVEGNLLRTAHRGAQVGRQGRHGARGVEGWAAPRCHRQLQRLGRW